MGLFLKVVADYSGVTRSRDGLKSADSRGDHGCARAHAIAAASEVVVIALTSAVDKEAAQTSSEVVVISIQGSVTWASIGPLGALHVGGIVLEASSSIYTCKKDCSQAESPRHCFSEIKVISISSSAKCYEESSKN